MWYSGLSNKNTSRVVDATAGCASRKVNCTMSPQYNQLSMFDQNHEDDHRQLVGSNQQLPHPLIVAGKWKFKLDYIDQDGDPDHYLYHAVQWTIGLGASNHATWVSIKNQFVSSTNKLIIHELPYISSDHKTYQVDFVDQNDCYLVAQEMRITKTRPQLQEIKDYLAAAGVGFDQIRRNPDKADDLKVLAQVAKWRREGKSEEWISERLRGKEKRNVITDIWQQRGAKGLDFAILTNEVNTIALGKSATKMTKELQIKLGQLRNHLDEAELGVIRVTESAASTLHNINDSEGADQLKEDIHATNPIAEIARKVFGTAKRK